MAVNPIRDGYHTVTPYITVRGLKKLIEFVKKAFDAEEIFCAHDENGEPRHAELRIGDSMVMMGEVPGDWQPMPMQLYLYVKDADATYHQAIQAGAVFFSEPADQFYGDRCGGVKDFAGNLWWIATHIEDLTPTQIQERAAAQKK